MGKRAAALCCIILIFGVVISGCSKSNQQDTANVNNEIKSLNEKYTMLDSQIKILDEEVKNLNGKLQEEIGTIAALNNVKNDILPVYVANINSYDREVGLYISIPNDKTLKEKLDIVAGKLSGLYFSGLPIEVVKIETEDNKKVVVVDLKESKENQGITDRNKYTGKTWSNNYFQGSTGGTMTSVCLIETFLQKEYKGEWVDGVRFTYNGGAKLDYEHVPELGKTNFR